MQNYRAFKNIVFDGVKTNATKAVLKLINDDRDGLEVDKVLIRSCVEINEAMGMGTLDVYVDDFEDALLGSTR
jgi:cullin 1